VRKAGRQAYSGTSPGGHKEEYKEIRTANDDDTEHTDGIIPHPARSRAGDDGMVGVYGNKERKRTTSCH